MSSVSEAIAQRITLGYVAERYGFDLVPSFASAVTVTSLADDVDSVRPGALFIPQSKISQRVLAQVQEKGAYAAVLPHSMRPIMESPQFPVMFAEPTDQQLGLLASDIAGSPSNALAVFAIGGENKDDVWANVIRLADFLHMLGNPVGVISAAGTTSLERTMPVTHPLGILDIQHILSVCAEDGAAAAIIALDDDTLRQGALQSVQVDVLGAEGSEAHRDRKAYTEQLRNRYGFTLDRQATMSIRDEESDELASQTDLVHDTDSQRHLSLSIAMVMAAGVRKPNIRSALRVSRELR